MAMTAAKVTEAERLGGNPSKVCISLRLSAKGSGEAREGKKKSLTFAFFSPECQWKRVAVEASPCH